MAGSRRETVGTIFSRMTGLLRAGAIKEEERPLWYDVVKAFPPRPANQTRQIPKILYPEDFVRAHFFKTFSDPGATVLTDERIKSVPQRFVDKYLQLEAEKKLLGHQVFDEAVRLIREEGETLITHQEREEATKATREMSLRAEREDTELTQHIAERVYDAADTNTQNTTIPDGGATVRPTSSRQTQKVDLQDIFKGKT